MSNRAAAILHNAEVDLQELITRRLAMVAANHAAETANEPIPYGHEDFERLARVMNACKVNIDEFR